MLPRLEGVFEDHSHSFVVTYNGQRAFEDGTQVFKARWYIHVVTRNTVNVENITVFSISLYSRFDNFSRILNHHEYSDIHYIYIFYLLFF
jgi:hypothetical protein